MSFVNNDPGIAVVRDEYGMPTYVVTPLSSLHEGMLDLNKAEQKFNIRHSESFKRCISDFNNADKILNRVGLTERALLIKINEIQNKILIMREEVSVEYKKLGCCGRAFYYLCLNSTAYKSILIYHLENIIKMKGKFSEMSDLFRETVLSGINE